MGNALLAQSTGSGSGGGLQVKTLTTATNRQFTWGTYGGTLYVYNGTSSAIVTDSTTLVEMLTSVAAMWLHITSFAYSITVSQPSGSTYRALLRTCAPGTINTALAITSDWSSESSKNCQEFANRTILCVGSGSGSNVMPDFNMEINNNSTGYGQIMDQTFTMSYELYGITYTP